MKPIAFFDTEIEPGNGKIRDIGSIKGDGSSFHSGSTAGFVRFLGGSQYICGHNIFQHDLKYIQNIFKNAGLNNLFFIDTLYLSPLLFPARPYHALLKDDKLQSEEINNPLNDAKKARDLFFDEVTAFHSLDKGLKQILFSLLKGVKGFSSFFHFIDYKNRENGLKIGQLVHKKFYGQICEQANIDKIASDHPVELAYCLALIYTKSRYSITPPWVLKNFPAVDTIMFLLRNNPCLEGCFYCNEALDVHKGLKRFFGFKSYRTFAGKPLQEKAVKAAVDNKSFLAVFPTGGGKSITFQVPALMSGISSKGLTVVISPLQSLMKDQVDNLEDAGITEAVTINGLLDPIERAKALERVENGSASMLYIAPESLRSRTIERLLLGRNVVRFVVDEAHCFSAWGQDFRVDYLYIGDFIKSIQEKKNMVEGIPVSCFTATAKQKVIGDIRNYFRDKLSLDMKVFNASAARSNLSYQVFVKEGEEEKYKTVRDLLDEKICPTIIYVSRTYKAFSLAQRLIDDGYEARPYHGKMDKQEKNKNQDAFIKGDIQIMVATSAFGMGVDKKDVGMVIHFDISDSLENYIQETGRAGRDEAISAECFVLYSEEDLNKHFILLNQTKLSIREIQQVWRAIKGITKFRTRVSQSALEIARKAGWDDNIAEMGMRVTTALSALEEAGYLKRGQNMPRIYANSILSKNAAEAIARINNSEKFDEKQKMKATRIIRKLFSQKSRKHPNKEEAESRVDYLADHLGIVKEEVIRIVYLLREEKILADAKDLNAYIRKKENKNRSLNILNKFCQLEKFLLDVLADEEKIYHLKELNEQAEENGCTSVTPEKIRTLFNFWVIKNWIKRQPVGYSRNHLAILCLHNKQILKEKLAKRHDLAHFIVKYLYGKSKQDAEEGETPGEEVLVEFSLLELKKKFENKLALIKTKVTFEDLEDALFYLSKIETLKMEGGFLVIYNALTIERLEQNNKIRYKMEDYKKLNQFYENKIQQIHIVGEYARKMISDYKAALQFVDDYFRLNYSSFLNKYFKGSRRNEIKRNITPAKFRQLFGELSPSQLKIINDQKSKYIVVAAGPGSGKTRILVHKLASLLLMEDVKHEQLLMVTFSRSAATEFKKRLLKLIGNAANFVEIKTFHSYCFDLLGRVGSIERSGKIIQEATQKIKNGGVEVGRVTKTVLVIDEAQDMDAQEFALINALMEQNEEMRVIAVGDDDQNIYEFRGASSKYLRSLIVDKQAVMYELVENFRSKSNLVEFANKYLQIIPYRLKHTPIMPVQKDNGKIMLLHYVSRQLIEPLVNNILSENLAGTTCVLTKTNDEALQVTGLLLKNSVQARLIQSNDKFNLYNLQEIRFFLNRLNLPANVYVIDDDDWASAKRDLVGKFGGSLNLEICLNMLNDFASTNTKTKYKSDLEIFIRESKLEDFFAENNETIFVSTMHKAKGREFDNVFLMLNQFNIGLAEAKRLLYVAMTRAKRKLFIHYNSDYLNFIKAEDLLFVKDYGKYRPPQQLAVQLSYKDVWLDYFLSRQNLISSLTSGDSLHVNSDCCFNANRRPVVRFSKGFKQQMETMRQTGYIPKRAKIRFIVYWQKEGAEYETKIILPELYFGRTSSL